VVHLGVSNAANSNCLDLWVVSCNDAACSCYTIRQLAPCINAFSAAEIDASMFPYKNGTVTFAYFNTTVSRLVCNDIPCTTYQVDLFQRPDHTYTQGNTIRVSDRSLGNYYIATSDHTYWKCWDALCYYTSGGVKLVRTSPYLQPATDAVGWMADLPNGDVVLLDTQGNRDSFSPPTTSDIVVLTVHVDWGTPPSNLTAPFVGTSTSTFMGTCAGGTSPVTTASTVVSATTAITISSASTETMTGTTSSLTTSSGFPVSVLLSSTSSSGSTSTSSTHQNVLTTTHSASLTTSTSVAGATTTATVITDVGTASVAGSSGSTNVLCVLFIVLAIVVII